MYSDSLKKKLAFRKYAPFYKLHISEKTLLLDKERILGVIQFDGMPFNTNTAESLERNANRQTRLLNELGKVNATRLKMWTHIIKRRVRVENEYHFQNEFIADFNNRYMERFKGGSFYQTRYYMTFVLKIKKNLEDARKEMEQLLSFVKSSTTDFSPRVLGINTNKHGVHFTEIGSFLNYLSAGEDKEIPLSSSYMVDLIDQGSVHFGYDFAEFRPSSGKRRYGVFYDLKTHPEKSTTGQWNFLLKEQCEFTLSQSFHFWGQEATQKMIGDQTNKLMSASNSPDHLVHEMEGVKQYVSSGDVVFGQYQGALTIYGDTSQETMDAANEVVSNFSGTGGTTFRRATTSAIYTYFSMFPGSEFSPFKEPKTARNLACAFSLHTYPSGKPFGNPLGDGSAVLPLETEDGGIYFYNTQVTPVGVDSRGEPEAGHVLSLGQTGAGKTTLEAVIINYLSRFNPGLFAIDYNLSMINNIRGPLEGQYFRIEQGIDSGINPFQWTDTPAQRDFLYSLVETLGGKETTAEERSQIKLAVDTVMDFDDVNDKRLSHVHSNIPNRGENCLRVRLDQWVHAANGRHAWALDSAKNRFNPNTMFRVGFDATSLLVDKNPVTEPLLATLFQMKNIMLQQLKGQLMVTMVAEFWAPANYPSTAEEIKKILKAGRLKGEICMLSSQSPESAINCLIFDDVVQQTPTKNLLPNEDAEWESYSKIGVSKNDFEELLLLSKNSRKFIIKQGRQSAIASIDLKGFDEFMPLISSTSTSINQVDELISELDSDDPNVWLPIYRQRLLEAKSAKRQEVA